MDNGFAFAENLQAIYVQYANDAVDMFPQQFTIGITFLAFVNRIGITPTSC